MKFQSFSAMLTNRASLYPDRPALISERGSVSYAGMMQGIRERASAFREDSCRCVAMIGPASEEWILTMFASVLAGKRTVLLDHALPAEALARLICYTEADRLCLTETLFDREELAVLHGAVPSSRNSSSGTPDEPSDSSGEGNLLFFTSGTTERSRAVVLTPRALCSSSWNGQQLLPCTCEDTVLSLIPLVHVFGFVCTMLWPISQGASVAIGRGMRFFTRDPVFFRPTILPVVPSLAEFFLKSNAFNPELETILVGAGSCSRKILSAIRSRGISVRFGYGLTETASGLAMSQDDADPLSMSLCPDSGITIADDGEILVKTTCMMEGYYKNRKATRSVLRDGVLHTGDLGHFDRKNHLIITGRKKDMIVLPNGKKIFCTEWEGELAKLLNTRELALTRRDGRILLTVVGGESRKEAVFHKVQEFNRTKPFDTRIDDVWMRQEPLPRTANGKLKRWAIR